MHPYSNWRTFACRGTFPYLRLRGNWFRKKCVIGRNITQRAASLPSFSKSGQLSVKEFLQFHPPLLFFLAMRNARTNSMRSLRVFLKYDRTLNDVLFRAAWESIKETLSTAEGVPAAVLELQSAGIPITPLIARKQSIFLSFFARFHPLIARIGKMFSNCMLGVFKSIPGRNQRE